MCGRYFFYLDSEELSHLYKKIQKQAKQEEKLAERIATGEVYPSNHVITLQRNEDNEIEPNLTRWGFQGFKKGKLLINAKSETVEQKKTFTKPFQTERCVFPMTGFYEWSQDKQKFLFTNPNSSIIFVAGFCRTHKDEIGYETESIIMTTSPNDSVSKIHDRMPLIVERNQVNDWILDIDFARELIKEKMPDLKSELVS